MNLKTKLQSITNKNQEKQPQVSDLNKEALDYIKKTLELAAQRGKSECSFFVIKLTYGKNYQIQSGEESSIELTSPSYLLEELEKEGLEVSLFEPEARGIESKMLSCKWN